AAARAEEGEELARLDLDLDVGERLPRADALRQGLDGDAERRAHAARQRRSRASSRASTASAIPASTSVQATVANILSCSNIEREFMISLPRPNGESSSSATIRPRKARESPRRRPARIIGAALGTTMRLNSFPQEAPKEHAISRSRGRVSRTPP